MAELALIGTAIGELAATAAAAAPTLSTIAGVVAPVATIAGTAYQAAGIKAQGRAAQQSAEFEAKQLEAAAKEQQAKGQREAAELRRRKQLALSELQSKSAAGGFTATDPASLAIADEIARYGTYQEQVAQYGGTSARQDLELKAAGRRAEGRAALQGSKYSAQGTILGGLSDFATKFRKPASNTANSYRYG
jgi:hypothetical protein